MTFSSRVLGVLLLAGPLLLSACSDSPGTPDAGTSSGDEWDGTYVPLQEKTDWVDQGPHATCSLTAPTGTVIDCGNPALFDLSSCNKSAVGAVDRQGVYQTELRYEQNVATWLGFALPADGGTGTLFGRPLKSQQVDGQGFFLTQDVPQPDGGMRQYALAGCTVPEPGRLTGCFARCTNGKISSRGTFDAERMTWARGESEASGGLRLLSESRVSLGEPVDVYVTKGHAYVVSVNDKALPQPTGGLTVFDVSDPTHPVLKKTVTLPNDSYWNGVWAKDDALYVASGASGVIVYDISNPADPAFVRNLPGGGTPINVHTVFVDGNRLYAMSPSPNAETLVFDVSSPLAPALLNRIVVPNETGFSYPHDAFAYQDRLYINHTDMGYVVMDVKDPAQPRELGRYSFDFPYSHANAVGTFAGRTIAFEGGEQNGAHLRVLDVTNPAAIKLIGEYKLRRNVSIHNMVLKDKRLYVAWYHEGLRVLDVSIPPKPKEIASFNTFRETDPYRSDSLYEGAIGVRVPGDGHVYVVDVGRGLLVFNEP